MGQKDAMSTYVNNIRVAALIFPVLSALLSVPYAIYQYRKYGSISLWKTFLVFSFIFYLMCAYFMVILPLPADHGIVVPGTQHPQLEPFHFMGSLEGAIQSAQARAASLAGTSAGPMSGVVAALSGVIALLRSPGVYTVYFNVLLTVPFGLYLRYLFHRPWWQALAMGFALSLFFEVSQLSGLFGLYEHPYRLFDVDDLITNTTGAMLGFWVSIPLCRFLPDLREVDERAVLRGAAHTTFSRRLLAFAIDMLVVAGLLWLWRHVIWGLGGRYDMLAGMLIATGVAFMVVPAVTRGQTIGHMVLRLRVVRPDGSSASALSCAVRYGLLFWVFLLLPVWVSALFPSGGFTVGADELSIGSQNIQAILDSVYIVWLVTIALRAVASAFKQPFVMLNGVMSNTRVMSEAQVERLRAERHAQSLEDELAQNDLGADLGNAFDASFDSVYSDELDAEIDEAREEDE